jgi:hypothetical protein
MYKTEEGVGKDWEDILDNAEKVLPFIEKVLVGILINNFHLLMAVMVEWNIQWQLCWQGLVHGFMSGAQLVLWYAWHQRI